MLIIKYYCFLIFLGGGGGYSGGGGGYSGGGGGYSGKLLNFCASIDEITTINIYDCIVILTLFI